MPKKHKTFFMYKFEKKLIHISAIYLYYFNCKIPLKVYIGPELSPSAPNFHV